MTDHPDLRSIQDSIDRRRERLAATLDELQTRLTVDALAGEALGLLRANAGACTRSLGRALRRNPLAVAMTGIGLAWLVFGGRKPADGPTPSDTVSGDDESDSLLRHETTRSGATLETPLGGKGSHHLGPLS